MTSIDPSILEALLHRNESESLDFKEKQYAFENASIEQKSEIVKDILAFANAWNTDDAHIILGARENPGGRAIVVGIDKHINDATLQEIVNKKKLNTTVDFEYITTTVDGKPLGVIRISKKQRRPIYLLERFGKLSENTVYVRRGSSTSVATPEEIARMGVAAFVTEAPQISLELHATEEESPPGPSVVATSTVLIDRPPPPPPDPKEIELEKMIRRAAGVDFLAPHTIAKFTAASLYNRVDPKELRAYKEHRHILAELRFYVRNIGRLLVEDVRIITSFPKEANVTVTDTLPKEPQKGFGSIGPMTSISKMMRDNNHFTNVDDTGNSWTITAHVGKLQPGATVVSKPFWAGSPVQHSTVLIAKVFADNLQEPEAFDLKLTINVVEKFVDEIP